MLQISQGLLFATTVLITLALVSYLVAVITARANKRPVVRETVKVGAGAGPVDEAVTDASMAPPAKPARGITWYGAKFAQGALVVLTASLAARAMATGHAPFYEITTSSRSRSRGA